jgi:MOSC domain-containing protein YiiM
MTKITLETRALLAGRAVPFRGEERSAFAKSPISGAVAITKFGLAGDEQGDPVHHGGPDKAIHLYPYEHYAYWSDFLGGHELLHTPGAFGENITSAGGVEGDICLGDRFTLGSALLEVSHGRQPCWKIDHRFGRSGITAQIVRTARCGIYLRVIEEGVGQAGDEMQLVDRPLPQWPVDHIFRLLIGGKGKSEVQAVRTLAETEILAQAWRKRAQEILG